MCVMSLYIFFVFFFKQKTAYEMRISDWSSDVCSSDLLDRLAGGEGAAGRRIPLFAGIFPFAFGESRRMDRPVIKALRRLSARAFVGEDRAGFGFARILERAISLERAVLAARQDEQRRAVAVWARDLQLAGVTAANGTAETGLGMCAR